ncbi:hit locus [Bdellovibrio bacteriovorus]|uniref:hit locus n=1 Tax=Bdellovibrio bacteriovorus TaxID=959 RepID=UPI0035A67F44
MKRLVALSILLALGFSFVGTTSSWAQEGDAKRTVNPGEDPNEARSGKALEADVAAVGTCPECIARMKHTRLGDDTTYRPKGSPASPSSPGAEGAPKEGTR